MRSPRLLLSCFLMFVASPAVTCENDEAKFSKEAETAAKEQTEKIKAEIASLGEHPWAGEYYHGDGLGVNVYFGIAPKSGYVLEWHGCLGLYDRDYGEASFKSGAITLSFAFPDHKWGLMAISDVLIPVSWGNRRYLVPRADMVGFCNEVNSHAEPRKSVYGNYLLRRGDEKKKAEGFPIVPSKYRPFLLKKPIEAAVTSVGDYKTRQSMCDWKFKDTPVTIDKGRKAGLLPGMELHFVEPADLVMSVIIKSVTEERADGIVTTIGEDRPGPEPGWKLCTKPRWND